MRVPIIAGFALAGLLLLGGCGDDTNVAERPPPQEVTGDSIGHYCGMALDEHPGPKAQIFLTDGKKPFWFSSVRDAFAFTMLPEEPKNLSVIYVNDMGRAKSWDRPAPGTWIDAKEAFFVINSDRQAGMGGEEAVPFGTEADAKAFAASNGGEVVTFAEVPRGYILPGEAAPNAPEQTTGGGKSETGHAHGH